jgi:hypothetical protein
VYTVVLATGAVALADSPAVLSCSVLVLHDTARKAMVRFLIYTRNSGLIVSRSFYCIILLTALFMASCYWPPVPIDTPLDTPWADNITTFADALLTRMPDLPLDMLPATIQIADRCWCDLAGGFFQPFNATQWEVNSVEGLKRRLERHMKEKGISLPTDMITTEDTAGGAPSGIVADTESKFTVLSSSLKTMWLKLKPLSHAPHTSQDQWPSSSDGSAVVAPSPSSMRHTPSWWKEYDLRLYGFDMIVDLRWAS